MDFVPHERALPPQVPEDVSALKHYAHDKAVYLSLLLNELFFIQVFCIFVNLYDEGGGEAVPGKDFSALTEVLDHFQFLVEDGEDQWVPFKSRIVS